ncbi:Protein of unknown function [Pyronema omphalodes CBS 100304]|uniref:Uncharacterized protein n=1 Tax=Pyronema omphalodes (strain CBS 100304) TaxID=1076935 RepID=U4LD60_PYROM|nr:Protein of unknown function [Pyronema omphalodes CBS 100304]
MMPDDSAHTAESSESIVSLKRNIP